MVVVQIELFTSIQGVAWTHWLHD